MNDLEVCKRIAEIEGYVFDTGGRYFRCELTKHGKVVGYIDYNPLTDDALCFQLMAKHKVSIDHEEGICGKLVKINNTNHWEYSGNTTYDENTTINKAICLAIIEVHND